MKSFEDIYLSIKNRFYKDSKIDIWKGSAIDMVFKSTSYMLSEAYQEIENNKKPYLFTEQTGEELDIEMNLSTKDMEAYSYCVRDRNSLI